MNDPAVEFRLGHVLDTLRALPAASVHCCVSSFPYWGLRAYGTQPQVWGGDEACAHGWGADEAAKRSRWGDVSTLSAKQASNGGSREMVAALEAPGGQFCQGCGAWRGEFGLEPTLSLFVAHVVLVSREIRRVLRKDGTFWLNLGDSYAQGGKRATRQELASDGERADRNGYHTPAFAGYSGWDRAASTATDGLKPKDLCMVPHRCAIALQDDGWWVRSDIVWAKGNPMPESIRDRPTKSHEYVFLLSRSARYYFDMDAVREPDWGADHPRRRVAPIPSHVPKATAHSQIRTPEGRNGAGRQLRSVWKINTQPFKNAHFATFPEKLVEPCILAGTSAHGACAGCGVPYVRVVVLGEPDRERQQACGGDANGQYRGKAQKDYGAAHAQTPGDVKARSLASMRERKTVGWAPSCKCGPEVGLVPCTVLDPFAGSGTVGAVAKRLGRRAILCDLKPEYLDLARERVAAVTTETVKPQRRRERAPVLLQPSLFKSEI